VNFADRAETTPTDFVLTPLSISSGQ